MKREKLHFWLIQRATIEDSDQKGIDGLLDLDYMGAAEFEFGSVPASLKRLRTKVNDYWRCDITLEKKGSKIMTLWCLPDHFDDIEKFIRECAAGNEPQLKEHTYIDDVGKPSLSKWKTRINLWWCIDENKDWVCWIKDDAFTEKFIAELRKGV